MEEPRKEQQAQEKVDPQPTEAAAPSAEPVKSGLIEERKETTETKDDVKETIHSETKATPPPDLSASVQAIIAHLNEGLELIQVRQLYHSDIESSELSLRPEGDRRTYNSLNRKGGGTQWIKVKIYRTAEEDPRRTVIPRIYRTFRSA
jgi:hypothetical protein